jgi:hypothetical protein
LRPQRFDQFGIAGTNAKAVALPAETEIEQLIGSVLRVGGSGVEPKRGHRV